MSSISGLSSSMSMYTQNTQSSQGPKPPSKEETFSLLDTDSSGGVGESELTSMLEEMSATSGTEISVSDSMDNYDSDGDGSLSEDELGSLMGELHEKLGPPPGGGGGMSAQGAADSYATQQTSTEDLFASLLEDLDSEYDTSSLTEGFLATV